MVVTAGGTQEPLDPVRSITNRSSGKQGLALAQAALDAGAVVTLIAAPISLPTPVGARRIDVQTAQDMLEGVMVELPQTDVLIMAAAVADFRPAQAAGQKIKKESGVPQIELARTPDILAEVAGQREKSGRPYVVVGFAAESQDLLDNARAKLQNKKLDLIVANDVSAADAGFSVDTNRVTLLFSNGTHQNLPLMDKTDVALAVIDCVVKQLRELSMDQADE